MKQMRDMLSYQTGLITGLQNTVSNLNTTVTTLYEDNIQNIASHSTVQAFKRRRVEPREVS